MNYRDVSPGDIILIHGEIKRIERVDRTHLATRGPNDSLELWSWEEDHLDFIFREDKSNLKSLGFVEVGDNLKLDNVLWDIKNGYCYINGFKFYGCNYLNTVQNLYYKQNKKELQLWK